MFGWLKRRAPRTVGLFGKIPAQGDFVRVNAGDPIVGVLDAWLEDAIAKARSAGAGFPSEPVRFLFRGAEKNTNGLVGVMAASRDAVGREFPLVIFTADAPDRLAKEYAGAPLAFAEFFAAATELLRESPSLDLDALTARLESVPVPGEADAKAAGDLDAALSAAKTSEQWEGLFGSPGSAARYYAFHTFASACRSMQKEDLSKTGATIDCPIAGREDVLFWLSLAHGILGWRKAPPSFFWLEAPAPRFLLTLGAPPSWVLLCLSRPEHDAPRLWPLKTADAGALEAARAAFDEEHRKTIEGEGVSNATLIAALARG